ncbi:MAG TPA: peptidoglycan-binding domain-containing protein [Candidatus Paceibacterota bacterium]|nr:peptidoglycan-binding domain-containing protein [Candidatus Paceibacterota bacterium]
MNNFKFLRLVCYVTISGLIFGLSLTHDAFIFKESNAQTNTTCIYTRDLRVDSEGEDVRALQQFLNANGYVISQTGLGSPGQETTSFGLKTQQALKNFQMAVNITPATGFFGPLTRLFVCGAPQNVLPTSPATTSTTIIPSFTFTLPQTIGARGAEVTALQELLVALGFMTEPPTGFFGPITAQAVASFQLSKGLEPVGSIGPQTRSALNLAYATLVNQTLAKNTGTNSTATTTVKRRRSGGGGGGGRNNSNDNAPPDPVYNTIFKIFDAIGGYTDKPTIFSAAVNPIYVGWGGYFFDNASATNPGEPSEVATRAWAQTVPLNAVAVPDIESWPANINFHSEVAVASSTEKYLRVIGWIRDERPDLKVGIYSIIPLSELTHAVNYGLLQDGDAWAVSQAAQFTAAYEAVVAASDFLAPIANAVDYIFPSLYTSNNSQQDWLYYAEYTVAIAERYGKPVYPFIWPRYHESTAGGLALQQLPLDFYRLQLDTLKALNVDGIVIWDSGWTPNGLLPWETFPWIAETEDFLEDNLIRSGAGASTFAAFGQTRTPRDMALMYLMIIIGSMIVAGGALPLAPKKRVHRKY